MVALKPPKDGNEDWTAGQIVAVLTMFGLVATHWLFDRLDEAVTNHRHIQAMLKHAFRELSITGAISFVLFSIEAAGAIKDEETLMAFENVRGGSVDLR